MELLYLIYSAGFALSFAAGFRLARRTKHVAYHAIPHLYIAAIAALTFRSLQEALVGVSISSALILGCQFLASTYDED